MCDLWSNFSMQTSDLLSLIALVFSVASTIFVVWLQFFRKKQEHLFLNVTWPQERTGPTDFLVVITNGGDLSFVICAIGLSYATKYDTTGCSYVTPKGIIIEY